MILVGNQRGGARDLAAHLLKDENEHVLVHELRGFMADDLPGAMAEAEALSIGTRCRQHLFSMSFNPPAAERVETEAFERAIDEAERRLGLDGQPRAVVFHEKEGRRHAHAVWSRIKAEEMKAVQLSFTKTRMQELSRDLYREHGWHMPDGLADKSKGDPRNFTLAEWQECKRRGVDPREIKGAIQDAWSISDSPAALSHALEERGLTLAKGDRRGAVVLDHNGKPYALAKYAGVKTKEVKVRLGETALPSIMEAKDRIASGMIPAMERMRREVDAKTEESRAAFERQRAALVERQREQRAQQAQMLEARQWKEARERQARFRPGLAGLWDRLKGEHARVRRENEQAALEALRRDRAKRDKLILRQVEERQRLTIARTEAHVRLADAKRQIEADRLKFEAMRTPSPKPVFEQASQPQAPPTPRQRERAPSTPAPPPTPEPPRDNRAERLRAFKEQRSSTRAHNRSRPDPDISR
jgi:hypothetical protein